MSTVSLGPTLPGLTVSLTRNRPWRSRKGVALRSQSGTPMQWPAAPQLIFSNGTTVGFALSSDSMLATPAAALSAAQVDAIIDSGSSLISLIDPGSGVPWAHGRYAVSYGAGTGGTGNISTSGESVVIIADRIEVIGGGGGGGLTQSQVEEVARDAVGAALVAGAGIGIAVDDPGDTITISSTAGGSVVDPVFDSESAVPQSNESLDGGWVLGAGWSGTYAGGFVHTPGATAPLTRPVASGTRRYLVTLTVTSPTNSSDFTVSLGGAANAYMYAGLSSPATYRVGFLSIADGDLVITPGAAFDGTITGITLIRLTGPAAPSAVFKHGPLPNVELYTRPQSAANTLIGISAGRWDVAGRGNTVLGHGAMSANISGYWNTAVGWQALPANTNGSRNVAVGMKSLVANTSGYRNVSVGQSSMVLNTVGAENTAVGADAMLSNQSGSNNVAVGLAALTANVAGQLNVAIGDRAMHSAETSGNIGIGQQALKGSKGALNIGIGNQVLGSLTSGADNTAVGHLAGQGAAGASNFSRAVLVGKEAGAGLATGSVDVTAVGHRALIRMTGDRNTAVGAQALAGAAAGSTGLRNVGIGYQAGSGITTGGYNTIIGTSAGTTLTTGSYNILIGASAQLPSPDSSLMLSIGNLLYGDLTPGARKAGIGVGAPTAFLEIINGTATIAPLKLRQGVLLTTPQPGAIEYDGTNLYFTDNTGARRTLAVTP